MEKDSTGSKASSILSKGSEQKLNDTMGDSDQRSSED